MTRLCLQADKNSIVQSAGLYLKELKLTRENLYRQNKTLREKINTKNILQSKELDLRTKREIEDDNMRIEEAKIEVQLMNPVSTIDSMIEALQCMKGMGVTATSIESEFSRNEFTTVMTINTKVLFTIFVCYFKIYFEIIKIYICIITISLVNYFF